MTRRYVTRAGVARLAEGLSERDWAIIRTLGRVKAASTGQLERLHFTDGMPLGNTRRCRRVLHRLAAERVVGRLDRRIGGVRAGSAGYIYALDVAGQRLLALSDDVRRQRFDVPDTPSWPFLAHRLLITELFVRLTEADRAGDLELVRFEPEPGLLALLQSRIWRGEGHFRPFLERCKALTCVDASGSTS